MRSAGPEFARQSRRRACVPDRASGQRADSASRCADHGNLRAHDARRCRGTPRMARAVRPCRQSLAPARADGHSLRSIRAAVPPIVGSRSSDRWPPARFRSTWSAHGIGRRLLPNLPRCSLRALAFAGRRRTEPRHPEQHRTCARAARERPCRRDEHLHSAGCARRRQRAFRGRLSAAQLQADQIASLGSGPHDHAL